MKSSIFWDITACSPLKVNRRFCLPPSFTLVSCSAHSTLKIEVICSSETSIDLQQTIRRFVPEDSTLQETYLFRNMIGAAYLMHKSIQLEDLSLYHLFL
jgi:hypothetical protein